MEWKPSEPAPATVDVDRHFAGGAIRLRGLGGVAWIEVDEHPPIGFGFGDLTSVFDEPELALLGTTAVVAAPPTAYILVGQGDLGLGDVTTGAYRLTWIDLAAGEVSESLNVTLDGGDESFAAPRTGRMVLALTRVGR